VRRPLPARLPDLRLGLRVGTDYTRRSGFEVVAGTAPRSRSIGRRHADAARPHVHGFPNLFVVGPGQAANLISNITHNLTEAATPSPGRGSRTPARCREVEVSDEAEQAWVELLEEADQTLLADPDCTPGYYNNEADPWAAVSD